MIKVYQLKRGILLEFPPLSFKSFGFYDTVITRKCDYIVPLTVYALWEDKEKVLSECYGDYKVSVRVAITNPDKVLHKYSNPKRILKQSLEETTGFSIKPYEPYDEVLEGKVVFVKNLSITELQNIIEESSNHSYVGKEILKQFILILKQQYG